MLTIRVMPIILFDGATCVRSVRFGRPLRPVGALLSAVRVYESRSVDELVLLSVSGLPDAALLRRVAAELRTPFAVGGGITSADDAVRLIHDEGADKVIVRTHAEKVVPEVARRLGSQAVVASVDTTDVVGAVARARHMRDLGAGEILLQSVDRDGTMSGPDIDLIGAVAHAVDCPVIYAGGIGSPSDAVEAVHAGADAVAAASMYHFTQWTPIDVKRALQAAGMPVREAA